MQYEDAFAAILGAFPDAAVVSTCGHISRDLFNFQDRPGNFYLVGSMGMAGPVALGISYSQPDQIVVAIDGDGSATMNMSGLGSVAASEGRILHVVLDNGQHGSTGGQRVAPMGSIAEVACGFGYRTVLTLDSEADLGRLAEVDLFPALVHVRIDPRRGSVGARVSYTPQELRDRFSSFLLDISKIQEQKQ